MSSRVVKDKSASADRKMSLSERFAQLQKQQSVKTQQTEERPRYEERKPAAAPVHRAQHRAPVKVAHTPTTFSPQVRQQQNVQRQKAQRANLVESARRGRTNTAVARGGSRGGNAQRPVKNTRGGSVAPMRGAANGTRGRGRGAASSTRGGARGAAAAGRGARGGRGRGGASRGGRGGKSSGPVSQEQLDRELDLMMGRNPDQERLDAELDEYWKAAKAEEAEAEADSGAAAEPEKAEAPEKEAAPADNASA